jgi:hypothetical protein
LKLWGRGARTYGALVNKQRGKTYDDDWEQSPSDINPAMQAGLNAVYIRT